EPYGARRVAPALDLARGSAGDDAKLQRGEPVAVDHDIDVGRVRFQRLAEHQARLAMLLRAFALDVDMRGERRVTVRGLPGEAEFVALAPDVGAARGERVGA